jgi:hypothetical protein
MSIQLSALQGCRLVNTRHPPTVGPSPTAADRPQVPAAGARMGPGELQKDIIGRLDPSVFQFPARYASGLSGTQLAQLGPRPSRFARDLALKQGRLRQISRCSTSRTCTRAGAHAVGPVTSCPKVASPDGAQLQVSFVPAGPTQTRRSCRSRRAGTPGFINTPHATLVFPVSSAERARRPADGSLTAYRVQLRLSRRRLRPTARSRLARDRPDNWSGPALGGLLTLKRPGAERTRADRLGRS